VELASESQELKVGLEDACEAILDGYEESLECGGKPFLLNEENEWLQKVYLNGSKSADEYWLNLEQLQDAEIEAPAEARIALESTLPVKHRLAGVGSLGRPRYTALATFEEEPSARETKPLLPSAALWADKKHKDAEIYYEEVLARAVRRLAPDCRRIELSELGPERDEKRMLRAMGWETGNIHLGTPRAVKAMLKDLKARKKDWLVKAAGKMVKATRKDWELWRTGNLD
jgi:hypothetical protein